ncbi:MAG TPA: DUF4153 domain-containing protein [Gemmatimonadales bacterium]|nr:DUF4153 domain-containing protein [Gemmatimonadales bacterium]
MRFPSITALVQRAGEVARRFPLTLLLGATAAGFAVVAVDAKTGDDLLWRDALVALLGLPLSVGFALRARYLGWSVARQVLWQAAGLLVLLLFFITWPGPGKDQDMVRFLQLAAILHLVAAVLPFIRGRETTAFWQYNRRLFESFLRAAVFAAVLFLGLAVALGALDKLFGMHVPGESYARLFFCMAFLVHPWIFLAGVPDEVEELEFRTYPRALKIFTQYVLMPLVAIYLVILVLYLGKIIVTGQWPNGWIGYLVTAVSVAGLLGFLLVHPLRSLPEEGWIRLYARGLFIGLVPAAIMLILALWKRVEPYGLTPLRTLGLVLAVWLLGIAVLYIVSRGTSIRTIPLSLAAVLAVCFGGPLGVRHLSVHSQANRLIHLLNSSDRSEERAREASAALGFLLQYDARGAVERIFGDSALTGVNLSGNFWTVRDSVATRLLAMKGVTYSASSARGYSAHESARRAPGQAIPTTGYDWLLPLDFADDTIAAHAGPHAIRVRRDSTHDWLDVQVDSQAPVRFRIDSMYFAWLAADSADRPSQLLSARTAGAVRLMLAPSNIWVSGPEDSLHVGGMSGQLLVGESR